jgi:hypothetical protein
VGARAGRRGEGGLTAGFVAIELLLGVATLLVPVVLVVASVPAWTARRAVATAAAAEAARALARDWPHGSVGQARAIATAVARDRGVAPSDLRVGVSGHYQRGGSVRVDVRVRLPGIGIGGRTVAGGWVHVHRVERIDAYRSRD